MSQQERSSWRDNYFPSQWHRMPRLPAEFLLTDLDAIEWRKDNNGFYRPVGFFEYKIVWKFQEVIKKIEKTDRMFWQLHLIKNLAFFCNTKAYFVGYEYGDELNKIEKILLFNVSDWKKGQRPQVVNISEWEYTEWLIRLK